MTVSDAIDVEHGDRLLVLIDAAQFGEEGAQAGAGGGAGRWTSFVNEVARVVGLEPAYLPLGASGTGWLHKVLRTAADWHAPVLVLPRTAMSSPGQGAVPRLRRALIASDDSTAVVRGARLASLHLLRNGVHTRVVLVLTEETAPPMWEGTGHHALAWRAELVRRHGRPTRIDVVSGAPGAAVRAQGAQADMVVLLWRSVAEEGHAAVVREVLDEGVSQPCLLLPVDWVEAAPVAAGLSRRRQPSPR
jgi:hypothetical protein